MGNEGTEVVGDGAEGLANAHAAAVLVDHPQAEDGVTVVEDSSRSEGLVDLLAVVRPWVETTVALSRTRVMLAPSRDMRGLRM